MNEKYLKLYIKAINDIDDYLEYNYESEKDKIKIMTIIDKLTKELSNANQRG